MRVSLYYKNGADIVASMIAWREMFSILASYLSLKYHSDAQLLTNQFRYQVFSHGMDIDTYMLPACPGLVNFRK